MNSLFRSIDFWRPYFTLEANGLSSGDLARQLDSLALDFPVRSVESSHEFDGQEVRVTRRFVEFAFSCGDRYQVLIEYEVLANETETQLLLVDHHSAKRHQLGWWDLARWHPFCLRIEELDLIVNSLVSIDGSWDNPHVPLLLLSRFVGLPDEKSRDLLLARVRRAAEALGLAGTGTSGLDIPLQIPDGNYRWQEDADLGWIFTSDEYACYSIRNRQHLDGEEGQFPFKEFRNLIRELKDRSI